MICKNLVAGCAVFLIGAPMLFSAEPSVNQIRYGSEGRRDPFIPLISPGGVLKFGSSATGLNIEGIIYDRKGGSIVIINGESYKEGDSIQNMNLISILRDRIILAQEDQEKVLWIREEIVPEGEKKHESKNTTQNP